jgi:hypothetical protein
MNTSALWEFAFSTMVSLFARPVRPQEMCRHLEHEKPVKHGLICMCQLASHALPCDNYLSRKGTNAQALWEHGLSTLLRLFSLSPFPLVFWAA